MNVRMALAAALNDIVGSGLLQTDPHIVAAPRSVDETRAVVQAAREYGYSIMPLGTGSSFPSDYSLIRETSVAVLCAGLRSVEHYTPFRVRVESGTPAASLLNETTACSRSTLGGLVCGMRRFGDDPALAAIWRRIAALEILNGAGDSRLIARGGRTANALAIDLFLGSRGRLGLITAFHLATPLPWAMNAQAAEAAHDIEQSSGDAVLTTADLQQMLDGSGAFHW